MLEQENTTLSQEQTEIPADLLPEAEGEKPEADALPAEPEKAAEPEGRSSVLADLKAKAAIVGNTPRQHVAHEVAR